MFWLLGIALAWKVVESMRVGYSGFESCWESAGVGFGSCYDCIALEYSTRFDEI